MTEAAVAPANGTDAKQAAAPVAPAVQAPVAPAAPTPALAPAPEAKPAAPAPLNIKAPEGFAPDVVQKFATEAAALGLSEQQAQTILERQAAAQAAEAKALADEAAAWAATVKSDPEIGGPKLAATEAAVVKAREKFASPALVELLDATGFGSHPEFVRLFARVGAAMAEGGHVPQQPASTGDQAGAGLRSLFSVQG